MRLLLAWIVRVEAVDGELLRMDQTSWYTVHNLLDKEAELCLWLLYEWGVSKYGTGSKKRGQKKALEVPEVLEDVLSEQTGAILNDHDDVYVGEKGIDEE